MVIQSHNGLVWEKPLPKKVSRQWQVWCNGQGYVKTAFGKTVFSHNYDKLDLPSLWVNSIDDFIANNNNVADMISVFEKAQYQAQTKTLNPQELGFNDIGHMKFFSSKRNKLWSMVIDWLTEHS